MPRLLNVGVPMGLGVDGSASNGGAHLLGARAAPVPRSSWSWRAGLRASADERPRMAPSPAS